jgi:hypothetical protein
MVSVTRSHEDITSPVDFGTLSTFQYHGVSHSSLAWEGCWSLGIRPRAAWDYADARLTGLAGISSFWKWVSSG